MSKKGPNFAYEGEIPIHLCVGDISTLKAELAQHESTCPGTYLECCCDRLGNFKPGPLEEHYREYAGKRQDILSRINLAEKLRTQGAHEPRKHHISPKKLTAAELIDNYMSLIKQLELIGQDSPAWRTVRQNLYYTRHALQKACLTEGIRFPVLPDMPCKPKAGRCTARKQK